MTYSDSAGTAIVLVVDMANVVGSVPDGWWRDRAAAAERLLAGLDLLAGRSVSGPEGAAITVVGILAVLEGEAQRARSADVDGAGGRVEVVRAPGSGDDEIVDRVAQLSRGDNHLLVVTADRGLRARLPVGVSSTGPGWLNGLLERGPRERRPPG